MNNDSRSTVLRNLVLAAAALAATAASAAPKAPVVATDDGPVRGVLSGGIDRYLGIPYAAAPVGALCWSPPHPHGRWHGVRDASQFANHCPQIAGPFGLASTTEDCLYLNVFTPARGMDGDDEESDDLRPVMVWIHGGALIVGESDDYDPVRLVQRGVVVVTINYRLGVLGFFAHPALSAEPGHVTDNYGLMDQQAALRWVQANIARFGGDPRRVTIFGESAGGLSTHSHLASPLSAGLFQHAIVESGAYALTQPTVAAQQALGVAVGNTAGCVSPTTPACLRALPVATLLASLPPTVSSIVPDIDGTTLTQSIGDAFASGQFNRVPVMEGSNHDEWRLFTALDYDLQAGPIGCTNAGCSTYPQAVAALLSQPVTSPLVLFVTNVAYPAALYGTADLAYSAFGTDVVFACNSRKAVRLLSGFVPTYAYEFNDENAPQLFLPPVSFNYASAHASEIQYLFNLRSQIPHPGLTPDQQKLSDAMVSYWTNFAKTGTPNFFGTPVWTAYSSAADTMQSLVTTTPLPETGFAIDHKCSIWAPTP